MSSPSGGFGGNYNGGYVPLPDKDHDRIRDTFFRNDCAREALHHLLPKADALGWPDEVLAKRCFEIARAMEQEAVK